MLNSRKLWYVFDGCELLWGPFDTEKDAQIDLDMMVEECYLLDDFPNPYVDFIWEDEYIEQPHKERIVKRKKQNG